VTEEQWLKLDQGRHAARTRRFATGAPALERLLCELPDCAQAWGLLAICYDALGQADRAENAAPA
jgi:predicted Zn-dependent protease